MLEILLALGAGVVILLVVSHRRQRRLLDQDFRAAAAAALERRTTIELHGISITPYLHALRSEVRARRPGLTGKALLDATRRAFEVECPSCGTLEQAALARLLVDEASLLSGQDLASDDARVGNIASATCPTCGRTTFRASFDPALLGSPEA